MIEFGVGSNNESPIALYRQGLPQKVTLGVKVTLTFLCVKKTQTKRNFLEKEKVTQEIVGDKQIPTNLFNTRPNSFSKVNTLVVSKVGLTTRLKNT